MAFKTTTHGWEVWDWNYLSSKYEIIFFYFFFKCGLPFNDVTDDAGKHLQALWKLQSNWRETGERKQIEKLHACIRGMTRCYLILSQLYSYT